MKTEIIIERLKAKRAALQADDRKYDGCVRLCRTKWYWHQRSVIANIKKTAAINIAIRILQCEYLTVSDIKSVYCDCFPECDRSREIEESFRNDNCNLNNLAWVLENAIKKYLPEFKKEVLKQPFFLTHGNSIIQIGINPPINIINVHIINYSLKEYLKKIRDFHHTFCHENDSYKANMRPILLSCCGKFDLKPNKYNFDGLLDAALLGVFTKDIQTLLQTEKQIQQ